MNVKVKICGIRTLESALVAADAGADFLGFNFVVGSKRRIDVQKAKEIVKKIKGKIKTVGVFMNSPFEVVNDILKEVDLDLVQLHGLENNEYIQRMKKPVIKSFTECDDPKAIKSDYLLLDRIRQGEGKMPDAQKAKTFAKKFSLFLAGGLNPSNISLLVKQVKPYGVDVAGGIETEGVQNAEKIRAFTANAKKEIL